MLTLRKEWDLATSRQFSERVSMALYHVAREVLDEDSTVPGHPLRRSLASAIVGQDAEQFVRYSGLVITDPAIRAIFVTKPSANDSDISDELLLAAVRLMWNPLCSYMPVPGS